MSYSYFARDELVRSLESNTEDDVIYLGSNIYQNTVTSAGERMIREAFKSFIESAIKPNYSNFFSSTLKSGDTNQHINWCCVANSSSSHVRTMKRKAWFCTNVHCCGQIGSKTELKCVAIQDHCVEQASKKLKH